MKNKSYRRKITAKDRKWVEQANKHRGNKVKNSEEDLGIRTDPLEGREYVSRYTSIPDAGTLDHIRARVPKNGSYGEIMFGFTGPEKPDYYVLKIELTEYGYVPTKLVHNRTRLNLSHLLEEDEPYEKIFGELKGYLKQKGSSLTADYIRDRYFETKEDIAKRGVNKDIVYFFEKHEGIPHPLFYS